MICTMGANVVTKVELFRYHCFSLLLITVCACENVACDFELADAFLLALDHPAMGRSLVQVEMPQTAYMRTAQSVPAQIV